MTDAQASADGGGTPPEAAMLPDHYRAPLLHAGFWRRVAAYLIDYLILSPVLFGISLWWIIPVFRTSMHAPFAYDPFAIYHVGAYWGASLLAMAIQWLYFALLESSPQQATVGKLALGLRVTDLYGRRIGFVRATGRFFGKIISGMILDIGYMMAGWTARKQALHDLMASCCVVRRDGLAAYERGELPEASGVRTGLPGWAIALIVVVVGLVCLIPLAAIFAGIAISLSHNQAWRGLFDSGAAKVQVLEGINESRQARQAVTQYIANHGAMPRDNAVAGLARPDTLGGRFVSSIEIREGQVVVTFGKRASPAIRGEHVVLAPQGSVSAMHWQCHSPDIHVRYLPDICR